jgi:hypothetical protein
MLKNLVAYADGYDRSWSIGAQGQVEERFLLFFDHLDERSTLIAQTALDLGVHPDVISRWQDAFEQADAMGLAFNRARTSIRLYLQYWDVLAAQVQRGDIHPFAVYLGFKSLPNGQHRDDVYVCAPLAPTAQFMPPISAALARIGVTDLAALAPLSAETCIFTQTESDTRRSFLATVRRADLDRSAVCKMLKFLPNSPYAAEIQRHAEGEDLLHIAGGQDSLKGDFTTLYFTCEQDEVLRALD